ncbi:MAG: twin-arginine translocation signal domain-containing protein, partial [Verrucomicrobiia bacterium]
MSEKIRMNRAEEKKPIPTCPGGQLTRRDFLKGAIVAAAAMPVFGSEVSEKLSSSQLNRTLRPPRA